MKNPWLKHSSKILLKNPWWKVRQDIITRPDGSPGQYNVVETPGSVFIVAVTPAGEVVFVDQFRYITGRPSLELPGGALEDDGPLASAKRELQEESGITARHWTNLGTFMPLNGLTDEVSYIFLAEDLDVSAQKPESEEAITRITYLSQAEIYRRLQQGEIDDGQTMAALFKAFLYLHRLGAERLP